MLRKISLIDYKYHCYVLILRYSLKYLNTIEKLIDETADYNFKLQVIFSFIILHNISFI